MDIDKLPEGWCRREMGGWSLYHGPHLPVVAIGKRLVLGLVVDLEEGCLLDESGGASEEAEVLVRRWGGRFLLIELVDEGRDLVRIWSDPAGSLCCFVHGALGWLASTPGLVRQVFGERFPERRLSERRVLEGLTNHSGTWYPAGLSELEDWELLAPSCATEIGSDGTVESRRIWPSAAVEVGSAAPAKVLPEFVARLEGILRALASVRSLEIPVSAGRDSRMLLACSRRIRNATRYSVRSSQSSGNCLEVEVSQALAEVLALDHHVDEPTDPERILCMGYGGEIARKHYDLCDGGDVADSGRMVAEALGFLDAGIPVEEMGFVCRKLEAWAAGLSGVPEEIRGDLLYLEQRMAPTMSVVLHRDDLGCRFAVAPLNAFGLYEQLFSLPSKYRLEWRVADGVCRLAWPATGLVPLQKTYFTGRERLKVGMTLLAAPLLGRDYLRAWHSSTLWRMLKSRRDKA